ncbi:unnamed protein product [Sphagnum balticum]
MQWQNHEGKEEGEGSHNQRPPAKNQAGGGLAAERSQRRASQGHTICGTRPPGRLASGESSEKPSAQLGVLVQVWRHLLKTFL